MTNFPVGRQLKVERKKGGREGLGEEQGRITEGRTIIGKDSIPTQTLWIRLWQGRREGREG